VQVSSVNLSEGLPDVGGICRLHQFCLRGISLLRERHHNARIIPIFIISCNTCSTSFLHDDDDRATPCPCICFTCFTQHFVILACNYTSNTYTYAIVTCELKATYLFIFHVSVKMIMENGNIYSKAVVNPHQAGLAYKTTQQAHKTRLHIFRMFKLN